MIFVATQLGSLKEELEFEQKLRAEVQEDLTKANEEIVSEQKKVRTLEKDIAAEKRAGETIKKGLQPAKDELDSSKARIQSLQADIGLEKKKCQGLQKRLQYEAAASVAVRMELSGKRAQIGKLEERLREGGKSINDESTDQIAEIASLKTELQSTNEKLGGMKTLEQKLRKVKAAAREAKSNNDELQQQRSRSSSIGADTEKDKLIRNLRRELHETRAKLKNERRNMAAPTPQEPRKLCPTRSLSDWMDIQVAPNTLVQHAGLIPIIQSPPRNTMSTMPRAIEASLPTSTSTDNKDESGPDNEPLPPSTSEEPPSLDAGLSSLFHYDEDDFSVEGDAALEAFHDELTFLKSAYDPDEINIEEGRITHIIDLAGGNDTDVVRVAIAVNIPPTYPATGVLDVKASVQSSTATLSVRKIALNALPELEEVCTWEAKANEGRETIHSIFSVASGWANTDWYNILSREIPNTQVQDKGGESSTLSTEMCVCIIHTHHLIDAEKIQAVKKYASKLSLGGYIKPGKPGLILVEGMEADCDDLKDDLMHCRKIFQTAVFKIGGKVQRQVSDIEADRCLPRKIEQLDSKTGMDEMESLCEKVGLGQVLNDIVS